MHMTSEHPTDPELVAFIDNELVAAQRADVTAHIRICAACESRVNVMRASAARIHGLLRRPDASSTAQQRQRLQRALREMKAVPPVAPSSWWTGGLVSTQWLQVAAVGLVACGLWAFGASIAGRHSDVVPAIVTARSSGDGALPLKAMTPGAVSTHTAAELCRGARPSRLVNDSTRREVLARYGMTQVSSDEYELDALITPELGGTTAPANLWPQRYDSPVWNARVKDELERLLPAMVCRGEIDLATAQHAMADDWIAAYKRFFHTETPLVARNLGPDDDDLVLLPASIR